MHSIPTSHHGAYYSRYITFNTQLFELSNSLLLCCMFQCQNEFKCSNMNCCSTLADFDDDDEDEDLSDTPNGYKIELWECEKRHSGDGEVKWILLLYHVLGTFKRRLGH